MALIQVVPSAGEWSVIEDGTETGHFSTQDDAEQAGRARARQLQAEFQLQGEDGRIREKDSYGTDPRESEG